MATTLNVTVSTETATEPESGLVSTLTTPSVESVTAVEPGVAMGRSETTPSVGQLTATEPSLSLGPTDVTHSVSTGAPTTQQPHIHITEDDWRFDNVNTDLQKREATDVEVFAKGMTLTWTSHITGVADLRTLNVAAGDVSIVDHSDGSWTAVDTALDDSNTFSVTPPPELSPALVPSTYVVRSYSESEMSTDVGLVTSVTVEFVREEPRQPDGDVLTETQDTDDEWKFEFEHGTIAPVLVQRSDQQSYEDVQIEMNLSNEQAEVIFESLPFTSAVSEETIPDGNDLVRDNNPDDANTVTIHRATNAFDEHIPTDGGTYVVSEWRARFDEPFRWDVSMTIRET